ncbi:MAG: TerC family protein [Dokdonella sp.]
MPTGFAIAEIIAVDILLGGDNAVVVALAARRLPPALRAKAIRLGIVAAIVLRIVFIVFVIQLLQLPFVRIAGGLALVWIAVKLMQPFDAASVESPLEAKNHLWGAVGTILAADAIMSMDNVLAIAAAAHGRSTLAAIGVAISVPMIIWGSKAVLALMTRFPLVVTFGGALLGWIGGGMAAGDASLGHASAGAFDYLASVAGALVVLVLGRIDREQRARSGVRASPQNDPREP